MIVNPLSTAENKPWTVVFTTRMDAQLNPKDWFAGTFGGQAGEVLRPGNSY